MQESMIAVASCYGASSTGQLAGAVATELVKENAGWTLVCHRLLRQSDRDALERYSCGTQVSDVGKHRRQGRKWARVDDERRIVLPARERAWGLRPRQKALAEEH